MNSSKRMLSRKVSFSLNQVSVLFHAEKTICESLLIIEYIDETWCNGLSIFPSDPYERPTARFWAAYIDEKIKVLEQ